MSLPQDGSRASFSNANGGRQHQHIFQAQPQIGLPSPTSAPHLQKHPQQQFVGFNRPTHIRPQIQQQGQIPQHKSPYITPYAQNNGQVGVPRQNGGIGVSAEQQIAQGVLSNASAASGSSTPLQRRGGPPPLGTTIHMPPHGTPQTQPMSVKHAMNPASNIQQIQRQSQNTSPALQNLGAHGPVLTDSPANSNLGNQPQDGSPDVNAQDMSMIDPQLAIDQHLTEQANNSMMVGDAPREVVQGEMLSPPPAGSFPTFDALFSFAQAHALAHGYAFVIGRSKRDNRGLKKVFLICDRGGTNKEKVPGEQRQRKTKSRKCGCEFGVFGLEQKTAWFLRGRIDGEHLSHNHPPSESPTEHPGARKLDPRAIAAVKALESNGVSVKDTLAHLHRENPNVRYLPRDIYNARAAIKRDPSRVEATAMESLPTFYKKPPLTHEEKLRAELRTEVANAKAEVEKIKEDRRIEIEELKEQIRSKDRQIKKFEMFIDICNERVMVQRNLLTDGAEEETPSG
ncbi:uncharacterized protein L3040_002289 [Drepanopeziza brunnea f. sp. 'multigermtubi']|uniref:Cell cycle control protein n=1 Tax=Marssonina brunnea f. sp. multigermtubi (strain MB_m1) TaxID=1072389 RepID=K1Y4C1_MARBU|nr:cell cycle control protein [Drepanopeziza brunnea f. sp. 'multigermtubi' MB_m1]EKD20034.1 cell cycle control protein [Drepanopeziza brunnea f. sp. 'multigermtubi' MB_m1]KAJ5050406.1 hypothetical protein L3040_002289 [Drepanopeziza brunnea f. sp. 'multigermtubi']